MALTIKPADIIKAKVIDFMVDNFDGVVIGDEVMYGSDRKIVDLLALFNGETFAIEIKSSKDDLRRFPKQISEYSKIFDHTLVFCSTEHISKVHNMAKSNFSVFEVSSIGRVEGEFINKRNKILKTEMLATMNSIFIRKKLNLSNTKNSDDIRRKAMKLKKETIHSLLFDFFYEKLALPYSIFFRERSNITIVDDMSLLSNRLNIE